MNILNSIIEYIKFLEKEYSLFVSIHCLKPPLNSLMPVFGKYNTHYHPYCLYIKSHPELWKKCQNMQIKVLNSDKAEIFYGECCFGVSEYVIPIRYKEENIGFISVSGYVDNKQDTHDKFTKISKKYNLNFNKLSNISKSLSQNPLHRDFVIATLCHIADALSVYANIVPQKGIGNNHTNYIYSNAIAYIHEHYTENIMVDDIAKFCNCSRSYITKLFKANSNYCIKTYITNLRMQTAKELLINSNKSIKEIAFYLGYNDSNYFSNVFRKEVGIYPREYKYLNTK